MARAGVGFARLPATGGRAADLLAVVAHDVAARAEFTRDTAVEPQRALAQSLHLEEVVRTENERAAASEEAIEPAIALALEAVVADREHLVGDQHLGLELGRRRERDAQLHARGTGAQGAIEVGADAGETLDLAGGAARFAAAHSALEDEPALGVLASGLERLESGPEVEQAAEARRHVDPTRSRTGRSGEQAQQRRLARSVATDQAEGLSPVEGEGDIAHRPEAAVDGAGHGMVTAEDPAQ